MKVVTPEDMSSLRQSLLPPLCQRVGFPGITECRIPPPGAYLETAGVYSMCRGAGGGGDMEARVEDLLFTQGFDLVSTDVQKGLVLDETPLSLYLPPHPFFLPPAVPVVVGYRATTA